MRIAYAHGAGLEHIFVLETDRGRAPRDCSAVKNAIDASFVFSPAQALASLADCACCSLANRSTYFYSVIWAGPSAG